MNKEMTINGKSYTIIKLLGKGKGGYSYLAESGNNRYVFDADTSWTMWLLSVRKQAYWWYAFLLPGAIAILCFLSHRKEENAGKYYSVFSMPVNLSRFEFAKGIILVEKLLVSAIFLALLISISNIIAPATAVYSLLHSITGSIGIILASVW